MKKTSGSRMGPKKQNIYNSNSDIISYLPGNILEKILMCLPIQVAVRTSILSRKWRYVWRKLPQLVFDDTFCRGLHGPTHTKMLMIIYQVMLLHRGPITKFALSMIGLKGCPQIDPLILNVSNNDIHDFTLCIGSAEPYKLPSSLYSCSRLMHLTLRSCVLKPPPGFEGFTRILSLNLCDVVISADVLSSLISSCPLLEDLTLRSSTSLDSLDVVGPNLKSVFCLGNFKSICFSNTPHLASVELFHNKGEISSSVVLLDSVPAIEHLGLDCTYVKGIAACGVPTRLPTALNNLKKISLHEICFSKRDEVSVLICLIRSSPNLEDVTIYACPRPTSASTIGLDFSDVHGCSDVSLNQLRRVNMKTLSGTKPELEFVKLMLAKSPMLETMLIELRSQNVADELGIVKELTRLRRASPVAEMHFARSEEDESSDDDDDDDDDDG